MDASSLPAQDDLASARAQAQAHDKGSLPGDLAVWIFIWSELLVFALFFIGYAVVRTYNIEEFVQYQDTLDRTSGAINTALLLTASWFVARAVAAIRVDRTALTANYLMGGIVCGAGFIVVKLIEYSAKFDAGIDLSTNTFYFFYLALTFFHFMHVILGMVILFAVWNKTRKGGYSSMDYHGLETGASYWHMVDLVWLILFPLVYVIR